MVAAVWATLVVSLTACERPQPDGSSDSQSKAAEQSGAASEHTDPTAGPIDYPDGPSPTPSAVLAEGGDIQVTLGEWETFMRRSLFFAPRRDGSPPESVPAERLANPKTQTTTLRSLISAKIIEREVDRRDLSPTRQQMREYVENHDKLGAYLPYLKDGDVPDSAPPLPDGLGKKDLWAVARRQVARQHLREALLEDIDKSELWETYRRRNHTVRLALASAPNSPSSQAVDTFIERDERRDDPRIEQHFEDHAKKYRDPELVRLTILAAPPDSQDAESLESRLRQAREGLDEGRDPHKLADQLDLDLQDDQLLVRKENREAFGADDPGATGYQMDGPRGAYAWRVEGWRTDQEAALDRSTRREIAAELLRREIVPSLKERLQTMREALEAVSPPSDGELADKQRARLRQKADQLDLDFQVTEPFPRTERGDIPGVGLAKPVVDTAFELAADASVPESPVLSRGTGFVFRILDRSPPSREAFEANYEAFRENILEERKNRVLQEFVGRWMDRHSPDIDLAPLQRKHGVLKKKD